MIKLRSWPGSFAEGFIAEPMDGMWQDWMRKVDQLLDDEQLVELVYEALVRRHPKSRTRGRLGTPAEVVLRMLVLKHARDWSFQVLEWEVRAHLVYRQFTRVYGTKVPDAKTLGRQALALGPEVIQKLQQRVLSIARENQITIGRKLRVDTTVVETNIHYPTDSSLLGDGVRVLTRVMKRVTEAAGEGGTKLRDRSRSVKLRAVEIARVSRSKSEQGQQRKDLYGKILDSSGRVAHQAQQFANEIASGVKRSADVKKQAALEGMKKELEKSIDTLSFGLVLARLHKGSRIVIEQTRVNDEVWLPQHVAVKVDARVALLKEFNIEHDVTYRDYKKFRADTKVVPMGEVAEPR